MEMGRLVLTRKSGESLTIGDDITVTVEKRGCQIQVKIDAPKNVLIKRPDMKKDINKNIIKEAVEQAKDGTFSKEVAL